jgi:hypothetical protein
MRCPADLWSGWRDLNPRPLVPQTNALTKLRHSPLAAVWPPAESSCALSQNRPSTHSIPCHARYPRYTARAPASILRCHGIGPGSSSSSPADTGACARPASTALPHDGHVPSRRTVDGDRNRSHASHHGTPTLQHAAGPDHQPGGATMKPVRHALRRRTRSFTGVGPRSNASRMLRSRYRR